MKHRRSHLIRNRSAPMPMAPPAPGTDSIKETLTLVRTHSQIRFVALPFFLGTVALLAKAYYDPGAIPRHFIAAAGLGISLVGLVVEIVLSRNLIAWWSALGRHPLMDEAWRTVGAHRHHPSLVAVRWAFLLPYAVTFAFWLHKLMRWVFPPPLGTPDSTHRLVLGVVAGLCGVAACVLARNAWQGALRK